MWASTLPQLASDTKLVDELGDDEKVPATLDDLLDWCRLQLSAGEVDRFRRTKLVLYDQPTGVPIDSNSQVNMRFQGVVASAHLGPFGNWNTCVNLQCFGEDVLIVWQVSKSRNTGKS